MFKIKKIKPMFTGVLCTADKYTEAQYIPGTTLIDPNKSKQGLKEYQTVLAVGTFVKGIMPGDIVCINPSNYAVRKYDKDSMKSSMNDVYNNITTYNFNIVTVNDKDCLLIQDRDIDFIVEGEEVPDKSIITIKPNGTSTGPLINTSLS